MLKQDIFYSKYKQKIIHGIIKKYFNDNFDTKMVYMLLTKTTIFFAIIKRALRCIPYTKKIMECLGPLSIH